jgi:hypothetical protein
VEACAGGAVHGGELQGGTAGIGDQYQHVAASRRDHSRRTLGIQSVGWWLLCQSVERTVMQVDDTFMARLDSHGGRRQ